MPFGAAAGLIGAAAPGIIGALTSGAAGQQAVAGNKDAANILQPYAQAGTGAVGALSSGLGTSFQQSPGYQWQLGQGIDAIQNSASAQGGVNSGNTLKALQTYGTGLANQDYYNWLNAQYNLANLGANAGQAQGNFLVGAGNANANATLGIGTGIGNALTGIGNFFNQPNQTGDGTGIPTGGGSTGGGGTDVMVA